jgi:hypothetical protein
LTQERVAAGIDAAVRTTLVSRGPILQAQAPYARRAFLPLLKVLFCSHRQAVLVPAQLELWCGCVAINEVPSTGVQQNFAVLPMPVLPICFNACP